MPDCPTGQIAWFPYPETNGCLDSGADGDTATWTSADIRAESEGGFACLRAGDHRMSPNRLSEGDAYTITADDATGGIPVDVDSVVPSSGGLRNSRVVIAVSTPPIGNVLWPDHASCWPAATRLVSAAVRQPKVLADVPRPCVPGGDC